MEAVINRLLALIDQSGLTDKQILKELDLSPSSSIITDWRRKKSINPSSSTIIKFANFFHVSTDYLLTGKINCDTISDDEKEWLALYKELMPYDSNPKEWLSLYKELMSYDPKLKEWLSLYKKISSCDPELIKECRSCVMAIIKSYQIGKGSET